jgi:chorismate mutase
MAEASRTPAAPPSLDEVRARIDVIDAELLKLLDERAGLAHAVAAAKAAAGDAGRFGLRPARRPSCCASCWPVRARARRPRWWSACGAR